MTTSSEPEAPARTVNLDIGNLAEVHMLSVNPAHITHVRLTGTTRGDNRSIEIVLVNGLSVGLNFDEPERAEQVFERIIAAVDRTILTV